MFNKKQDNGADSQKKKHAAIQQTRPTIESYPTNHEMGGKLPVL